MRELATRDDCGPMLEFLQNATEVYGPALLLEARIIFRSSWVTQRGPKKRNPVTERTIVSEIEYDGANNFARMGADFVDDEWVKAAIAYHQSVPRGSGRTKRRNGSGSWAIIRPTGGELTTPRRTGQPEAVD